MPTQHAAAIALARWARERIPLYRDLYADAPPVETWQDFQRLPVLTSARLRTTPLAEQVDTLDDVLRSQTAYALQSVVTPRALVLDSDDTDVAFDQTRAAFALAGCRRGTRVALVTHPRQRYIAAEIADQLGYFRIEAHLVIALDSASTARTLKALAPQRTVFFDASPCTTVPDPISIRRPHSDGTDLYLVPEAGIVAVRPQGEAAYRLLNPHCLLENAPGGSLLLTALLRYHQPLIRYQLPDKGHMKNRRLVLEEVAP